MRGGVAVGNRALISILAVGLISGPAAAETFTSAAHGAALELPAGWQQVDELPSSKHVLLAVGPHGERRIQLMIHPAGGGPATIDDDFIRGFEQAALEQRGDVALQRISGRKLEISGRPGYELVTRAERAGQQRIVVGRVLPAHGRYYILQGTAPGDAARDAQLMSALGSFRLTGKPEKSLAIRSLDDAPAETEEHNQAYEIGRLVGQLFIVALILAVLGWALQRRKKGKARDASARDASARDDSGPRAPDR